MLSPEAVCEKINNIKGSETLEDILGEIDLSAINNLSHTLTITKSTYKGATLLWCALAKIQVRRSLVEKLLTMADADSVDLYAGINAGANLAVIMIIPDDLIPELIQKAKGIDINCAWAYGNDLLVDVLKHQKAYVDILKALLQKGVVDVEALQSCIDDRHLCASLDQRIQNIISRFIRSFKFFDKLPNSASFQGLMGLLAQNDWLFDACRPNTGKVTLKDQIIMRLTNLRALGEPQLREFYNRFPQFKPDGYSANDNADTVAPPAPVATSSNSALTTHTSLKPAAAVINKMTLHEILYQNQTGILIKRLEKGEIAFDLLESFAADNNVGIECTNIINACLSWRKLNYGLPDKQCFTNVILLFQQNDWLFKVRDESSKKSILELTIHKLGLRRNNQLDEFKNNFPDSDTLLNQINTPEPSEQQLTTPEQMPTPQEISADVNARTDAADVSQEEKVDEKPVDLKDAASTSSAAANTVLQTSDRVTPSQDVTSLLVGSNTASSARMTDEPLAVQLRKAIAAYSESHSEGSAPASLAALARRQQALALMEARAKSARDAKTQSGTGTEGVNGAVELTQCGNATAAGNYGAEPVNGRANSVPPRDVKQVFVEITDDFSSSIYNRENISYQEKPQIISSIKSKFTDLITNYNNSIVNENNRHDLLDVLCALYKNICEPEHKKKINIHYRARYDRFFKKPNTQSWQDMVKDIRDKSLICLLDIAAEQSNTTNAITLLNTYINEPLFCEHRSNVAICRIGSTSAVGKIKDRIKEYESVLLKLEKQSRL